jgi:hypothetical protein
MGNGVVVILKPKMSNFIFYLLVAAGFSLRFSSSNGCCGFLASYATCHSRSPARPAKPFGRVPIRAGNLLAGI